ncbi:ribbon-helix-helix domain-containing protein [Wenzhouxiangella limi]|uniref:Methionine repressor-like protein n=1 Tax=Wenzhouxiangella limi TaxID=2707351 RepID=A0A845V491_9GAMM|nr:ribbon-helix-helix domain-containing protein [Wenzhouxiangella limi]NDY97110.1 methionine repressor-like protein [Wenzhouxiangella limi]
MTTVRWNIAVSAETDRALRMLLARQGGRKGDLSRFIEDAVRERLFEQTASMIKDANANYTPEQIDSAVEEVLDWARRGE